MKKGVVYFIFLFCVLANITYSQGGDFVWVQSIGGSDRDVGHDVSIDNGGNIYTVGAFEGTVDFDPGSGIFNLNANGAGLFIKKLDENGDFVWARAVTSTDEIKGYSIAVSNTGNLCITGAFNGTVDFDPGPGTFVRTSNGSPDIYILSLNVDGDFLWAKTMGGTSEGAGKDVAIDATGNVYTTGAFSNTVDFDPGTGSFYLTGSNLHDIFVQKLDVNGNFIWAKAMTGSITTDEGYGIVVDAQENVYTTGRFSGVVDFDPGLGIFNLDSEGNVGAFIQKLDINGNFLWAKSIGGQTLARGSSITLDASNNVLIAGVFFGRGDFDPGSNIFNVRTNGNGGYVLKLDNNGNFLWAKGISSATNGPHVFSSAEIITDTLNSIYLAGSFSNSYDFDPGLNDYTLSAGGSLRDNYVLKLDSMGNFVWAKSYGGSLNDYCGGSALSAQGSLYLTGYYNSTADFDPGVNDHYLTAMGDVDAFLLKLSACEASIGIAENNAYQSAIAYPNPTSGVVTLDLEDIKDATIKVFNINGQVVYQQAQVNGIHQFELAAAPGVYTIEVTAADTRKYVKLIKQ